jgi:hypothetical protein
MSSPAPAGLQVLLGARDGLAVRLHLLITHSERLVDRALQRPARHHRKLLNGRPARDGGRAIAILLEGQRDAKIERVQERSNGRHRPEWLGDARVQLTAHDRREEHTSHVGPDGRGHRALAFAPERSPRTTARPRPRSWSREARHRRRRNTSEPLSHRGSTGKLTHRRERQQRRLPNRRAPVTQTQDRCN